VASIVVIDYGDHFAEARCGGNQFRSGSSGHWLNFRGQVSLYGRPETSYKLAGIPSRRRSERNAAGLFLCFHARGVSKDYFAVDDGHYAFCLQNVRFGDFHNVGGKHRQVGQFARLD